MRDHLAGISIFVEAVEAGGFSAAAERLNLSRSSVGKAIARLEERLGTRLFHRTTRSTMLTDDGNAYYEHCLQALEAIRAGEAMLESGRHTVSGRVRISMPVLFGRYCVVPILVGLARRYPELELELSFSDKLVNLVEDGFDLAVRNGPLDHAADHLIARKIARQHMVVCAAPSYVERHGQPECIEDLGMHGIVAYGWSGYTSTWRFPKPGKESAVMFKPQARLKLDDLEAIADLASQGMGLAWLPYWLVKARIQSGTLVPVLEHQPGFVMESYALWPQTQSLPFRLRVVVDALSSELPKVMA